MIFVIVEDGKQVRYERKGSCNMCGACCQGKFMVAEHTTSKDEMDSCQPPEIEDDWSDWEGWSAYWDGEMWQWWKVTKLGPETHMCPGFINGKCRCHETKPDICKTWPWHPNDILAFPECGYSFSRLND